MSLIKCPDCKHKISRSAPSCPYCGRPMKGNNKSSGKNNNVGCSTYIFLAIIVFAVIGWFSGGKDNDTKEAAKVESTSTQTEKVKESSKTTEKKQAKNTKATEEATKDTPTPKPEPVSVEDSTTLYYLDLYENYKQYNDQYVTISAPIESADGEDVVIKGEIDGMGEISLTLLEPRSDLKQGDFITATGLVDGRMFKILYMKNVNIAATGNEPAQLYAQQKEAYDSSVAQAKADSQQSFISSCQKYSYEDLVRYPDTYEDSPITDTLVVEQVMPGGFLTSEGYRCYEVGTENEIVLFDDRETKEPKFVEGDTVTVYGTYYGTEKMERLFTGEKVSVPCINFQYANIN